MVAPDDGMSGDDESSHQEVFARGARNLRDGDG